MSWNREHIDDVAVRSAQCDYWAFELVGLSETSAARVLDVGCFDGFNTVLKFGPYRNIERVVGIDPDEQAIELARASTDDERFEWRCVSLDDLHGEDESFDLVYLSHTFQHLLDKSSALEKCRRLLKNDGFLIAKTVDDSLKVSEPDPDAIMERVLRTYEDEVIRNVEHTRHTDRRCGSKMHSLLTNAGFADICTKIFHTNTSDMDLDGRRALFSQMTYFRNPSLESISQKTSEEMHSLLDAWQSMFEDPAYFFDTATIMSVARKTPAAQKARERQETSTHDDFEFAIEPMREDDLGEIMAIETRSFSDPWTPVAYAMEIRHNPDARYVVARDADGSIKGYIGCWNMADGSSVITHVATDPQARRTGVGTFLVSAAKRQASADGCNELRLTVRSRNRDARGFYEALGFVEAGVYPEYYANPVDDGLLMVLDLDDPR